MERVVTQPRAGGRTAPRSSRAAGGDGGRGVDVGLFLLAVLRSSHPAAAQPSMVDPNLGVRAEVTGLATPTTMAFLGPGDFFVLEKATGKVQRVVNGAIQGAVLDLPVNSVSERGLLGIALHTNFPTNPGVYPYWTESSTGMDVTSNSVILLVGNPNSPFPPGEGQPLGNRVDGVVWNGSSLTYDRHLIALHAYQNDTQNGEQPRANHNGGQIHFGPDGKLYPIIPARSDGAGGGDDRPMFGHSLLGTRSFHRHRKEQA